MGIDVYMPRWSLPAAAASAPCSWEPDEVAFAPEIAWQGSSPVVEPSADAPRVVKDVLRELVEPRRAEPRPSSINSHSSPSVDTASSTIPAFALSIWRPYPGLLVIDEREAKAALPTEVLLHNILRAIIPDLKHPGGEEILPWPLVENAAVSHTREDAETALQVWLEVELERRPSSRLILMGRHSMQFFYKGRDYRESLWHQLPLLNTSARALISCSLVELLRDPLLKRQLWQSLPSFLAQSS